MENFIIEVKRRYNLDPITIKETGYRVGEFGYEPDGFMMYFTSKVPFHIDRYYYNQPTEAVFDSFERDILPLIRAEKFNLI